jgi:hypothetical protein
MAPRCIGGSVPGAVRAAAMPARDQKAPTSYEGRRVRPLLAVAGDAAVDEARIPGRERVPIEREPRERGAAEVRHEDVRAVEEPVGDFARLGPPEIEHDAAFAAVVELERRVRRQLHPRRRQVEPAERVAVGRLDLDDLGAPVGEHPAGRGARDPHAELDHANACKWTGHTSYGCD